MEKPMEKLMTVRTQSTAETEACGAELAKQMLDDAGIPPFIALYGDLGVGKTAFVRGFASVIAPGVTVRSPTFALVNEYKAKPRPLFHFDMYRLGSSDELFDIGWEDYLTRGGVCAVEWSERVNDAMPADTLWVDIARGTDESDRIITITGGE